ncbi:hypothetical protein AB4Y30_01445 [Ornithinibacillus sp. 4-3]|uniref:Uncharacterized protein n=1 Tax=Ornithinibacillus sp. 4-3 TaxID=3231488 RepID=A0AB39HSS7_9BACI
MNNYYIQYYHGAEVLAKEFKEFKNESLAISYVRSLDDVFVVKNRGSTQVVFKSKLTNIKITEREPDRF